MSAPVKKCEVCDDTGSKSRDMGGDMDCTACNATTERMVMRIKLGLTWGDDDAWRAYQLGKAVAAPVVPVAAQPVVPEGWRVVQKKTCYVLVHGNLVVASLAGPDAEANAAIIANAIANIETAAPSLEAQPAGEASAPNAALVALKEACDLIRLEVADGVHTEEYRRGMAALSAAGQEVGHG